ncbi:MAG: phasin family protein [Ideonella sp.]|jgi:poly(hydroxyalkanoate) granule-associated protein|nr:phasin family protein [Ideonella sp.]
MVKKLKKLAEKQASAPTGLLDGLMGGALKDSAQQLWHAGQEALAKAQGGRGKVIDTLMKEGASLQRKTQAAAEGRLGEMAGKVTAMAGGVGTKANAQWDKLESIFEERTARAMNRLGVPTAKDVAALAGRVDALAAAVAKLTQGGAAAKAGTPKKAAAKAATPKPKARTRKAAAPSPAMPVAKPAAKRRSVRKTDAAAQ